jgi:hypothetical protein
MANRCPVAQRTSSSRIIFAAHLHAGINFSTADAAPARPVVRTLNPADRDNPRRTAYMVMLSAADLCFGTNKVCPENVALVTLA